MLANPSVPYLFFFNDTATTEIYTLSLHDALPICLGREGGVVQAAQPQAHDHDHGQVQRAGQRSEEHTSELQSLRHLVCRLLLEKKTTASSEPSDPSATQLTRMSAWVWL